MQDSEEIKKLLIEIRDAQLEQLAEYRRVTQRSLELQQQAVTRQEQLGALYQRVVAVAGGLLIIAIVLIIVYLLGSLR